MSTTTFPLTGRLAGIDFGTVRIGIAITDPERILASPFENYTRQTIAQDAQYFRRLVVEERIAGFVVGLPIHTSGRESEKSAEARRFGQWLAETTCLPVCFFDERYTTSEARQMLGQAKFTKKKQQRRLDMLAAQVMLAAFLESSSTSASREPAPLD